MEIRQSAIDRTKGFEKFIAYLYLDINRKVTLGYGHMVPSTSDMDDITMSDGGAVATSAAKRAAWTTIKDKTAGSPASSYEQYTTVRIAKTDAELFLTDDLTQASTDLASRFPKLDSYPEAAQDALLDMMFNIGKTKFTQAKWKNLFAAVSAKNWTTAADESHRTDVPDNRNDAIRQLFLDAASSKAHVELMRAMPLIDDLLQRRVSSVIELATASSGAGKLFPNGITNIHISVSVGGASIDLQVSGPPTANS